MFLFMLDHPVAVIGLAVILAGLTVGLVALAIADLNDGSSGPLEPWPGRESATTNVQVRPTRADGFYDWARDPEYLWDLHDRRRNQ